ncbi:MAG: ATP-binding domain-containing protein, partial [Abditibacteriota bacterium]|nr:ATP-binding domain-containing protein [Abditibacteriota bacterium]
LRRYEEDGLKPYNPAVLTMLGWDKALKELSDQPGSLGELAIGDLTLKRDPSLDLFAEKSLIFTTVRKFKGMEADHVIILHAGEKLFAHSRSEEQLFYTACSRACLYLDTVLTHKAAREFLRLAEGRELTPELAEELLKMKAEICL